MSEHHHKGTFVTKFIFSQDHKMISKQFLITGMIMGTIGLFMSMLFRLQLSFPDTSFSIMEAFLGKGQDGGVMTPDTYLSLVTIHGTIMVFFVLTAGLSGTFSNLLIPLQIGARDMASGFLNMISYWLFFISSVIMVSSLFIESGPAAAGWTIYPPLSALPQAMSGSGLGMTLWLISMALFIASSLIGALNYIVTVLNLRTLGMKMTRLPLTIWAFFTTAVIGVVSFPVLLSAALLLIFDRSSEVMATNSRKPIFGYRAMIGSILAIAFLSTVVWGHHMFVTGMNPFLGSVFTFTTLLIAIPSAVKAFNWITTLWKGNLQLNPAMLFSIGFVSTFITGGLTGIVLGDSALDINVHDTYFVVAHFHLVMGVSAIFGMFAGIYHWFPKMYGRMMNKDLGYLHFWLTIISAYGVFFPMHFLGLAGLPRRYYTNTAFPIFDDLLHINHVMTIFALIGGIAQILFFANFFFSMKKGPKASQNPWRANSLEWTTPVEHIHGNWPGEIPEVHRWAYDYSKLDENGELYDGQDFTLQTVPARPGEEML